MFNKLRRDKRAITGMIIATVVALVTITIIVPIGIIITSNLYTVSSGIVGSTNVLGGSGNSSAGNATKAVFDTAWQAYNLAAILSIVAAAGAIISIIVAIFAVRGRQQ